MRVAVFGLGIIGSAWADNLTADGLSVARWNRSPKAQPGFTPDARAAAEGADLLIVCVSDPAAVDAVLAAIRPALRQGQIVVQTSTVGPSDTLRFAETVRASGADFLECPFTGSKPAAQARQTVFFAGGDPAVLERARPTLTRLSKAIEYIGPLGSASALKLAFNLNISLMAESLCESLAFARAAGIPDETYFRVFRQTVAHSGLVDLKQPKLMAADWSPQFSVKHMAKDIRLALGTDPTLRLPQTAGLLKLYEAGLAAGFGDDDFISLARLLGRGAG
jgi:3-hydroxyisobutyrate dehydrogenase-like beta-hydroxyacid dehydrogenase